MLAWTESGEVASDTDLGDLTAGLVAEAPAQQAASRVVEEVESEEQQGRSAASDRGGSRRVGVGTECGGSLGTAGVGTGSMRSDPAEAALQARASTAQARIQCNDDCPCEDCT